MKIYRCKCHDAFYRVCPECSHQYCPQTWHYCPRCADARAMTGRPLAAAGLISYRYPNPYGGWIMIGAADDSDALREAQRSLCSGTATRENLQRWNGSEYVTLDTSPR